MNLNNVYREINIFNQCRRYGLPLWQCPQFLFVIMGLFIISSTLTTYAIGTRYLNDPQIIVLIVLLITAILLVIAFIITQSFERLAEANRMKTEFISIVSHQLRSPLTNLRWAVDLLVSGDLGDDENKKKEFFNILKENGSRMEELISDLLIVSRMETEKITPKKTIFSLEELVQKLVQKSSAFAKSYNAQVNLAVENDLPKIQGDAYRAELIVENLLDNAIKYVKNEGKIEIKILKKNGGIYFEIKDEGIGIPREDQKYIFQKFFRAGNARQTQTLGSGLGLYICKAATEKNGGKIGFKSEENKGSTFWFTLPIH